MSQPRVETRLLALLGRPRGEQRRHLVLAAAAVMIGAQLGFRAWALYPSWFFTDDYRLMLDAQGEGLSWSYLMSPFDSQFMPAGRLVVWFVTHSGTTSWWLAATSTLVLHLAATLACAWMLFTLFGLRTAVLPLLGIYLSSAMALPGFMWWAAAINQLPLQVVVFVCVTTWVTHLRRGGWRWAVLTWVVLAIGLLAYVKVLLVLPVLAYLLLAYFCEGSLRRRLGQAVRRHWRVALVMAATTSLFLVFYVGTVTQPFTAGEDRGTLALGTADGMLGTSFPTSALGGPWRWFETSPPTVLVGAPSWSVHASWVVVSLVVAHSLLRRRRAGRAWVLLAAYCASAYVLLATSRGQLFGRIAGLELRYLTDVLPILVLALGLAFITLPGAVGSSDPREVPLLTAATGPRWVAALTAVVVLGGLASSWQYVRFWHHDNAGHDYVTTIQNELRGSGPVDLAPQIVPGAVMPEYTQPRNNTNIFVPLVAPQARFPTTTSDLHVLDDNGFVRPAEIIGRTDSLPGPEPDCGWRVEGGTPVSIPLENPVFDYTWWIRIGYLGSLDSSLSVRADSTRVPIPVRRGLHSAFLEVTGAFDRVTVQATGAGAVCIDTVEVGSPAPRESP